MVDRWRQTDLRSCHLQCLASLGNTIESQYRILRAMHPAASDSHASVDDTEALRNRDQKKPPAPKSWRLEIQEICLSR